MDILQLSITKIKNLTKFSLSKYVKKTAQFKILLTFHTIFLILIFKLRFYYIYCSRPTICFCGIQFCKFNVNILNFLIGWILFWLFLSYYPSNNSQFFVHIWFDLIQLMKFEQLFLLLNNIYRNFSVRSFCRTPIEFFQQRTHSTKNFIRRSNIKKPERKIWTWNHIYQQFLLSY